MLYSLFRRKTKRKTACLIEQDMLGRLLWYCFYLATLIFLHILAMLYFEGMSLDDAVWLSVTTTTTVGYGDLAAATVAGRSATVILLYFGGIFLLAKIAGDYFEYRIHRKEQMLKGFWRWNMRDHIIIINTPSRNGEQYFERLVGQFRVVPRLQETPIQILTRKFPQGLPTSVRKLGAVHFTGSPDSIASLQAVNAQQAAFIIILAQDEYERISDSLTFDILHRIAQMGVSGHILAEYVLDENRNRFITAGANSVLRPIRAYPELIVRAVVEPGTEQVLEDMFTFGGNHTRRYLAQFDKQWGDVACAIINLGLGTPIAYLSSQGEVICGPDPHKTVVGQGVFILVNEKNIPSVQQVQDAIASVSS